MIEVLFAESEAGAMKFAKSNRALRKHNEDGPTSVFGDVSEISVIKEWISVPGTAAEVICLSYHLDIGDIQQSFDSDYRNGLILSMYTQSGWETSEEHISSLKENILTRTKEYERLMQFMETREDIRIWYSSAAYSLCGFYELCSQLVKHKTFDANIYTIELPEHVEEGDNRIVRYRHWGEVMAEKMSSFLSLQKKLSVNELKMYAHKWADLIEDNSPLRAFVNGELIGVPEDFYDFLIRKSITKEPVREARLIGDILGKYPVCVGDWWYGARIEQMIQNGEIRVVEDSPHKYRRMICSM